MVVPHRWEQWLVLPSTKKKKKKFNDYDCKSVMYTENK